MKRVVKKGYKKRTFTVKFKLVFVLVFIMYIFSSIFWKNYNIELDNQLQKLNYTNEQLANSNETKTLKIDELSSFDRLSSIAQSSGLKNYEGSIKNVE
ncbi:MAG: hypothetical protein LBR40_06075 [Bacilli bacterium]|jgi:cell division protein FtsL|nr:hypothetical protein [Bacilli bacterium]